MKRLIVRSVINLCYKVDSKLGKIESYDYETAPYCGHHYSGHNGWLTSGSYHEGDGGESASLLGFKFCSSTDNEYWWHFRYKVVRRIFLNGEFIAQHNIKFGFFREMKYILKHYKLGFRLKYGWRKKCNAH